MLLLHRSQLMTIACMPRPPYCAKNFTRAKRHILQKQTLKPLIKDVLLGGLQLPLNLSGRERSCQREESCCIYRREHWKKKRRRKDAAQHATLPDKKRRLRKSVYFKNLSSNKRNFDSDATFKVHINFR